MLDGSFCWIIGVCFVIVNAQRERDFIAKKYSWYELVFGECRETYDWDNFLLGEWWERDEVEVEGQVELQIQIVLAYSFLMVFRGEREK